MRPRLDLAPHERTLRADQYDALREEIRLLRAQLMKLSEAYNDYIDTDVLDRLAAEIGRTREMLFGPPGTVI